MAAAIGAAVALPFNDNLGNAIPPDTPHVSFIAIPGTTIHELTRCSLGRQRITPNMEIQCGLRRRGGMGR